MEVVGGEEMKNLSDEELVLNYCISCMEFDRDTDVPPEGVQKNMSLQVELLARLERGRKAIEAMEKIAKARLEDDYDEFAADVDLILRKYQQSRKEAADGN
jgi:Zn-dependent M32 family carboxypeptidase